MQQSQVYGLNEPQPLTQRRDLGRVAQSLDAHQIQDVKASYNALGNPRGSNAGVNLNNLGMEQIKIPASSNNNNLSKYKKAIPSQRGMVLPSAEYGNAGNTGYYQNQNNVVNNSINFRDDAAASSHNAKQQIMNRAS